MSYSAAWKVLEAMIADFKKKGLTVLPEIMNDLKTAKTLINILKADHSRIDITQKVEGYLLTVESYLISEGQKKFGSKYVNKWLEKLDEASRKTFEEDEKEEEETTFIPSVPREYKWIRVKPSAELPIEKLKVLAEKSKLSYNIQSDGHLLVYGEEKCVKEFVKNMATKYNVNVEK